MVGVLVISHGNLADALIASVQSLVGNLQRVKGISILPKDKAEDVKSRIQREIVEVDEGDGVVMLTDLPGGTPTYLGLAFLKSDRVEIVTGVNLPMLLTLSSYRKGRSLREIGQLVKKSGRRSIALAKEMGGPKRGKGQQV